MYKKTKKITKDQVLKKYGYRSGLEEYTASFLTNNNIQYTYESEKIQYIIPESYHKYTPDFILKTKSGKKIYIETKGRFVKSDMKKHILIKQQNPDIDIRFVFQKLNQKIRKGSILTYKDWCDKNGFIYYAEKIIPIEWLNELNI